MIRMPLLMGILNVTPDSFSDGGDFFSAEAAIDQGIKMVDEGADIVDVGGESTRPGAEPVEEVEELRRVIPVVGVLASRGIKVSIDTMKPGVAQEALKAGASIVNDVGGLRDPEMIATCAISGCTVIIMHMQGEPRSMQQAPNYEDVVSEVRDYLVYQARRAEAAGVSKSNIWVDPGIGFGKTLDHNLSLLRNLDALTETGYPVLVGVSRKSFIGKILGSERVSVLPEGRLFGTIAAQLIAWQRGAKILRVHDVRSARESVSAALSILSSVGSS